MGVDIILPQINTATVVRVRIFSQRYRSQIKCPHAKAVWGHILARAARVALLQTTSVREVVLYYSHLLFNFFLSKFHPSKAFRLRAFLCPTPELLTEPAKLEAPNLCQVPPNSHPDSPEWRRIGEWCLCNSRPSFRRRRLDLGKVMDTFNRHRRLN